MDKKKKELEAMEKEVRKLCRLRTEAENKMRVTSKYKRLKKTAEQWGAKRTALRKERDKLKKKIRKKFLDGKIPYPQYSKNANAFYGGDTNIRPKVLRAIEKIAPLSKLKATQIEETVSLLIIKEEHRTPKLTKILDRITNVDIKRSDAWDKQDELVREVDTFSSEIVVLNIKIESLKEEIEHPEKVKTRETREAARSLIYGSIDKIYDALTKKKRR